MTSYIEFLTYQKKHPGVDTPTGKGHYNGLQDFINFAKDRKLSILVTEVGDVYAVGDAIIAHLSPTSHADIDLIEKTFKGKVHWPTSVAGYDIKIEPKAINRAAVHFLKASLHDVGLIKGRRKKPWKK